MPIAGVHRALGVLLVALSACSAPTEEGDQAAPALLTDSTPEQLFSERCASCHELDGGKAPSRGVLAGKSVGSIVFALNNGSMRSQAESLSHQQRVELALWLSDQGGCHGPPHTLT